MILDSRLEFARDQELTANGALTNIIDVEDDPRNMGPGRPLYLVLAIDAINGAATFTLQTDDADTFGSPTDLASITVPDGSDDQVFVLGFPYTNEQYLRVNANVGTSVTVSAYLTDQEPLSYQAYPAPSQA